MAIHFLKVRMTFGEAWGREWAVHLCVWLKDNPPLYVQEENPLLAQEQQSQSKAGIQLHFYNMFAFYWSIPEWKVKCAPKKYSIF